MTMTLYISVHTAVRPTLIPVVYFVIFLIAGSAILGPVCRECADLWPRIASNASSIQ